MAEEALGNPELLNDSPENDPQNGNGDGGDEEEDTYLPFKEEKAEDLDKGTDKDDAEIDDEDAKVIKKVITKETAGVKNTIESLQKEVEINDFLQKEENEGFRQFADQIKVVAKDPRTRGLSINAVVALAIGANKLLKIGAEKERAAALRASRSATGGTAIRNGIKGGIKSAWELSDEEFNKVTANIR